jgi:hypothetical protein
MSLVNKTKIPLVIFAYRRPDHLRQVLEATLSMNNFEDVQPHIYVDGPRSNLESELVNKTCELAQEYVASVNGTLTLSVVNKGLSKSVINGVSSVLETSDSIIVLEDDLVPSKYFLDYSLNGLAMYKEKNRVSSIHGYLPDIKTPRNETFFRRGADCWGWSTWRDRWQSVTWDSDLLLAELSKRKLTRKLNLNNSYCFSCMLERQAKGQVDSWAIRWHVSMFLQNRLALYPNRSLIMNIGFDGTGEHGGQNNYYDTSISQIPVSIQEKKLRESRTARRRLIKHYRRQFRVSLTSKASRYLAKRFALANQ